MDTTRTFSEYFSPNSAIAPVFLASSMFMIFVTTGRFAWISLFTNALCLCDLFCCHGFKMCEVKTQSVRSYQGTFLFYMVSEYGL